MKTKLTLICLVAIFISGLLASCSSSNQVASNFYKRKYTRGHFFNRPEKLNSPTANKVIASIKSTNPNCTSIATSPNQKGYVITSQPRINQNNIPADAEQITKDNKKVTVAKRVNNSVVSYPSIMSNKVTYAASSVKYQDAQSPASDGGGYHAPVGDCKDWILALVLCFFLGGLGIHRFYLGYTTIGIIQLLTLGGCGIWALIDFIRIIMKTLPPYDGKYCDD